jgi:hypothetical protein
MVILTAAAGGVRPSGRTADAGKQSNALLVGLLEVIPKALLLSWEIFRTIKWKVLS